MNGHGETPPQRRFETKSVGRGGLVRPSFEPRGRDRGDDRLASTPSDRDPVPPVDHPACPSISDKDASTDIRRQFDIRPVLRLESDVFDVFPLRIAYGFESYTRCLGGKRGERVGVSADSAHSPAVEANTGSVLRIVESLGRALNPNISDIPTPPTGVSRTVLRLLQVRRNCAPSDSELERFAHLRRITTRHFVEEELIISGFLYSRCLIVHYFSYSCVFFSILATNWFVVESLGT